MFRLNETFSSNFSCFVIVSLTACTAIIIVNAGSRIRPVSDESRCKGKFLSRAHFIADPAKSSITEQANSILSLFQRNNLQSTESDKHLQYFTTEDIVKCLDDYRARRLHELSRILINERRENLSKRPLHIAFLGDSRIRQQFFSLFQLIPANDFKESTFDEFLQIDRYVTSRTLNLAVSFSWEPSLIGSGGEDAAKTLKRWLEIDHFSPDDARSNTPDFLILGTNLHEMLRKNNGTLEAFATSLSKIKPLLEELAQTARVVWFNSYPVYDFYAFMRYPDISQSKINEYNAAARRILRDSCIEIWDSTDALAAEYNRACFYWYRVAEDLWGYSPSFKCHDRVHAGNVAINPSTHLLLNEICH